MTDTPPAPVLAEMREADFVRYLKEAVERQREVTAPEKLNIMLCRFPGGEVEHPACVDWVVDTSLKILSDPRTMDGYQMFWVDGTPVTVSRNWAVRSALERGADILIMVDNDMGPDIGNQPFWPRALDFMLSRWDAAPTIVGAPYCGKPPDEDVCVKIWRHDGNNLPPFDMKIAGFEREEAALRTGYESVAATGTGLIAIDMRVFTGFGGRRIPPPWFYYEYSDEYETQVTSTEDIVFTRNVQALFEPIAPVVFVDWDAWAAHYKHKRVIKPLIPHSGEVMQFFERVARLEREHDESQNA